MSDKRCSFFNALTPHLRFVELKKIIHSWQYHRVKIGYWHHTYEQTVRFSDKSGGKGGISCVNDCWFVIFISCARVIGAVRSRTQGNMLIKILSHPGHGNHKSCNKGNWTSSSPRRSPVVLNQALMICPRTCITNLSELDIEQPILVTCLQQKIHFQSKPIISIEYFGFFCSLWESSTLAHL